MEAYLVEWLNILVRWLHFVTGIAWIGSSLYFIWLDNHLKTPRDDSDVAKGVGGEVWSVHGGGFYHAQKYKTFPVPLPTTLHWFKWEAYWTWMSGMFLLGLIYFLGAEVYLIDRSVADLSVISAILISLGFIIGGWVVYDLLCKSPLARDPRVFAIILLILCTALAWALCNLFSGRAAYILFGATLGTVMVANVAHVIIPGQKIMVAAAERGELPDPSHANNAKLRSVHNTYFTLPVLFVMTSNHFAMTYSHPNNWLILIAISMVGALIRVYFVARHKGSASPLPIAVALLLLAALIIYLAPASRAPAAALPEMDSAAGEVVEQADVGAPLAGVADAQRIREIVATRCANCHSATPTHPAFPAAPLGVALDTDAEILAAADRIYQQTVVTRVMPIGNLTAMTDEEREILGRWYQSLDRSQ